jgi:hypothetical protein
MNVGFLWTLTIVSSSFYKSWVQDSLSYMEPSWLNQSNVQRIFPFSSHLLFINCEFYIVFVGLSIVSFVLYLQIVDVTHIMEHNM